MGRTARFEGTGPDATGYTVGQRVRILKYGCEYPATVVKVGKTTVTVNFTPRTGPNRDFTFPGREVPIYVRPEDSTDRAGREAPKLPRRGPRDGDPGPESLRRLLRF